MAPFVASHLKDMNRQTVYALLATGEELSKAEISRRTGISGPTVFKVIDYFRSVGFLTDTSRGDSALGRKPDNFRLDPDARYSVGIELEGDYARSGLVNLANEVVCSGVTAVEGGFDGFLKKQLVKTVRQLVSGSKVPKEKITGIGLGVPGVVRPGTARVSLAPMMGVCRETDYSGVLSRLSSALALPVYMENDVNVSAIGEFHARKMTDGEDLVFLSLGTGLGAGIILKGELRTGSRGIAGEIGYMVYDSGHKTSASKVGWLEDAVNIHALTQRPSFMETYSAGRPSGIRQEDLDGVAARISPLLGTVIANIAALLDIRLFVIGGIAADVLGPGIINEIRREAAAHSVFELSCEAKVCGKPGIVGAAKLSTDRYLEKTLSE